MAHLTRRLQLASICLQRLPPIDAAVCPPEMEGMARAPSAVQSHDLAAVVGTATSSGKTQSIVGEHAWRAALGVGPPAVLTSQYSSKHRPHVVCLSPCRSCGATATWFRRSAASGLGRPADNGGRFGGTKSFPTVRRWGQRHSAQPAPPGLCSGWSGSESVRAALRNLRAPGAPGYFRLTGYSTASQGSL